jgi:hypothetical protein
MLFSVDMDDEKNIRGSDMESCEKSITGSVKKHIVNRGRYYAFLYYCSALFL